MPPMTRAQWRSLDQLADTPAFREFMQAEFPAVTDLSTGPERRGFLKLMAASLALAGLSGCGDSDDPRGQEVAYVNKPLRAEPGAILRFASVALTDGIANGVLVTTRDGRPIKIEGNPEHPWTRGGTDVFGQASILDLYDPARSQTVRIHGRASDWQTFRGATLGHFAALRAGGAQGLRLLTGPVSSPSLRAQVEAMLRAFPGMRWHTHVPVDRTAMHEAALRAFGRPLEPRWHFDRARVVVALDGDFLDPGPQQVGLAANWVAARRQPGPLLALHAAASLPSLTSAKADHPLVATPADIAALAQGLAADLASPGGPPGAAGPGTMDRWRAAAAAALHANRGASLVIAGSTAPAGVQEAVHRLNQALGNAGSTVEYVASVAPPAEPLAALVEAMNSGTVTTLVILDANPAYDAPGTLDFTAALRRVPLKIHAGAYEDETGLRCDWHLPLAHPLEAWGDARSADGTVGLMQPTIAPLYDGRSPAEVLSLLAENTPQDGLTLLQAHWQGTQDSAAFAPRWEGMLRDGFIAGSALPAEVPALLPAGEAAAPADAPDGLTLLFRPDPTVWDGRVANNGWLQELPKPLTKTGLGERAHHLARAGRPRDARHRRRRDRRRARARGGCAGLGAARPGRRHRGRAARLRPQRAGPRLQRRGLRRLQAARDG